MYCNVLVNLFFFKIGSEGHESVSINEEEIFLQTTKQALKVDIGGFALLFRQFSSAFSFMWIDFLQVLWTTPKPKKKKINKKELE